VKALRLRSIGVLFALVGIFLGLLASQVAVFACTAFVSFQWSLWAQIFARVIWPRIGAPTELEDALPHRFGQFVGFLFTALALIILALALYLLTPENYLTIGQAFPGAVFFSLGWMTMTKLFQVYVARYDRYNPTYLALASIIVLLTWMYLTCLLLLLGGKLNAILRHERERAAARPTAEPQPA
jgi:YihY family inner membrane protein